MASANQNCPRSQPNSIRWYGDDPVIQGVTFQHGDNGAQEFYQAEDPSRRLGFGILRVHQETFWQPYVVLREGSEPFYFLWLADVENKDKPLDGLKAVDEMLPALADYVRANTNDAIVALMHGRRPARARVVG